MSASVVVELAIPATPRLVTVAAELGAAVDAAAEVPVLRARARDVGLAWVEELLDGFVLPLAAAARGPGAGQRTRTMIRDLAESLVGTGVKRLDLARARAFVEFLRAHVVAGPPPELRFAIDDERAARIRAAVVPDAGPGVVAPVLHATVDLTLARCLDEPLALLGLGVLTRTAARVGRVAIASRVRGEIDRAVLDAAARARLQATLAGFVRAEPARSAATSSRPGSAAPSRPR